MKQFFIFSVILICFSCKENFEIEQIEIPEPKEMEVIKTTLIPVKCAMECIMIDSLLIMNTYCDSMCFSAYNKLTHEFVINFGNKGEKEFDFSFPLLFKSLNYDAKKILSYDLDRYRNVEINLDSIVKGGNPNSQMKYTKQDKELWWTMNLSYIDKNKIVGSNTSGLLGAGMLFIYDTEEKEKQWIDFSPKYKYDSDDYLRLVYENTIETNKNKQTIAVAFRCLDMINFYNFDGSVKKRICFSKVKKPNTSPLNITIDDAEKHYFLKTFATYKYFYAIRYNVSGTDLLNKNIKFNPVILKLDWEGNLVEAYRFNKRVNSFCVDEDRGRIYIITFSEDEEYEELIELQM